MLLAVGVIAAAAAGATVAGALLQGGDIGGEVHGRTATGAERQLDPPALELTVVDRDDEEARALREAERLYETDDAAGALDAFEDVLRSNPRSVEAATGAAVAAWPDRTVERLEELADRVPDSAVVRLNLGLALFAAGNVEGARAQWREAEKREADSPAALRAEDLLNPDSPPGRPRYLRAVRAPERLARLPLEARLAELRQIATGGDRTVTERIDAWVLLGSEHERIGHRVSAQRAYDEAASRAPDRLDLQVAASVARFDKDRPAEAFSRLGPLTREHPRAAVLRYHLGLLLLWLPNVDEATRQLRLASATGRRSLYAKQAARLLASLEKSE